MLHTKNRAVNSKLLVSVYISRGFFLLEILDSVQDTINLKKARNRCLLFLYFLNKIYINALIHNVCVERTVDNYFMKLNDQHYFKMKKKTMPAR